MTLSTPSILFHARFLGRGRLNRLRLTGAHKLRNLENKLKASQRPCLEAAKIIYQAHNQTQALKCFGKWQKRWQARAPKASLV